MVSNTELEQIMSHKMISDAQISPDGELIAFVIGDQYIHDTQLPKSSIWITSKDGSSIERMTSTVCSNTNPRWSPDGKMIAFLSDEEDPGKLQIYVMDRSGAKKTKLTYAQEGVTNSRGLNPMAWSPAGDKIAFIQLEITPRNNEKAKLSDVIEFEQNPRYERLHSITIKNGDTACISPKHLQIWEFCWSPDGKGFAAVASGFPFAHSWYNATLVTFTGNSNRYSEIHRDINRQLAKPTWSNNGSQIAFISSIWSDRGLVAGGIFIVPKNGGKTRELTLGHIASDTWLEWRDNDSALVTIAHERGYISLSNISIATGSRTTIWKDKAVFSESHWPKFSSDRAGNIAVVKEDTWKPREIFLFEPLNSKLNLRQLTNIHRSTRTSSVGSTQTIHWKGADELDIQGLFIKPSGSKLERNLPMITIVHGGPTNVYTHQYYGGMARWGWMKLLSEYGYAIFLPNPRGSTGWGLDFAESNIGDMGGKDWEDIQRGIDFLIEEEFVDPNRQGIAGWSYGGFMAAWAITQTNRFKCAMVGAGISDWRSFHGKSYLCDWDAKHYGNTDPWDPDGLYRTFSPITHVRNVTTPTLIIHGEKDDDVPVEQSYLLHRALKDLEISTELIIYPREPHGPQERNHITDINTRIISWFSKYLSNPFSMQGR